jgi:hypothetical protein
MHKYLIQAMVYQRLPKRHPTYGFHFLHRKVQAWWEKGLRLCFEADTLFSRCNHRHYHGHNREMQNATLWHRETATHFCTDALWENLKANAKNNESRAAIHALHTAHQGHLLFLHHTMESLLYVANTILPPLQHALRKARKMLKRWSWLPWIPNAFVRYYDTYLTGTQEKLDNIQQQLCEAIEARVILVLQSNDGKMGDVILSLIAQLRQEVPGFISDERLKASEIPLSYQERLQGKKQRILPSTKRQVRSGQLAKAVQYLFKFQETRASLLAYIEETNGVDVVDKALPLSVKINKNRLLLLPREWQCEENASWRDTVKVYPWCRQWRLQEGLALLQLKNRMRRLMDHDVAQVALSTKAVITQLDLISSMIDAHSLLARYQKQVAAFRPKRFWFRFAKWEKTTQYQAWTLQQQQLDNAMKQMEHQHVAWIIRHAPDLIKNASVYSPRTWTQIIDVVRSVTLPRLAEHGRGEHDPTSIELCTAYQRLRIASSPFLAGEEEIENYLRGEEACTVQAIKILLSTQTSISQDHWAILNAPSIITPAISTSLNQVCDPKWKKWIETTKQGLLTNTDLRSNQDAVNAILNVAEKMAMDSAVDLMQWPGRFNLYPEVRGALYVNVQEIALPSLFDRLCRRQIPSRVRELRFIINVVARLSQWDKSTPQAGQQQQALLEYLNGFESVLKTPKLLEVCRKLLTELQSKTVVLNDKAPQCDLV